MTAGSEVRERWIHAALLGLSALHPGLSIVESFRRRVAEPGEDPEPIREQVPA